MLAVDFGTSNTGAAMRFADGRVEKVQLGSNSDTMPSAVVMTGRPADEAGRAADVADQWRVGQAALNARRTAPGAFVGAPKARLGQEAALFGDDLVSPAQIVSHVLRVVRERSVRAAGGTDPDQVVVTHPVDWGSARLDALCEAAVLAGFPAEKVWLLPEPIAAFHAHTTTKDLEPGSRVAVVDIGGGTSDVAVLETTPNRGLTVVAQTGDDRLGGNDLDDLLYRWVIDQLTLSGRDEIVDALDDPQNLGAVLTLLDVVRAAKQELSEYPTAPVAVAVAGMETVVNVSRTEYETVIAEPMARVAALLTRALQDSRTTTLRQLLLTGGPSHTPALARELHKITGILAQPLGDPKLAVATGALRTPASMTTPAGGQGPLPAAAPAAGVPAPALVVPTPVVPQEPARLAPAVTLLSGRYELAEVIGEGGMAQVHAGRDQLLGRQVAIKVPNMALARDPAFRERFQREAKMAARLNHPAIVGVYDIDEADLPAPTGGTVRVPFIVMERIVGNPLTDLMPAGRPMATDQALSIGADVLGALEFSHQAGVVHRDVKPGNVMLTRAGTVKVMDFGIARPVAHTGATVTEGVVGTAAYLSPEQALGQRVDTRSDLYSAGCLLFEMLTGRPPFVGESAVVTAFAHINDTPPRPCSLNSRLPSVLDDVLAKALAKEPGARYQDASAFRADLDSVRRDPTRRPPGLGPARTPAPAAASSAAPFPAAPPAVVPAARAVPLAAPAARVAPAQVPPGVTPVWVVPPPQPAPKRSGAGVVAVLALVVVLAGVAALGQVQQWWPWTTTTPTAGPTDDGTGSPQTGQPPSPPKPSSPAPPEGAVSLNQYISSVTASSELPATDVLTYYAGNVFDGRLDTAWNEGAEGPGVGEWIEVTFSQPVTITQMHIANGYQKNADVFDDNGWPTTLGLADDGGYGEAPLLSTTFGEWDVVEWPPDVQRPTSTLRLTIVTARAGRTNDAAISEIDFWGSL
ncbi:MAG: Hsp70 family protein [Micrococcales bacterium]|nr:Hsp70 family protein [Micrococcales bacterium]MCL2668281.1 Hsp70 family protein [Micrococcales bacterium]